MGSNSPFPLDFARGPYHSAELLRCMQNEENILMALRLVSSCLHRRTRGVCIVCTMWCFVVSENNTSNELVLYRYIENIEISIRYRYIVSYRPQKYRNFRYIAISNFDISFCRIFIHLFILASIWLLQIFQFISHWTMMLLLLIMMPQSQFWRLCSNGQVIQICLRLYACCWQFLLLQCQAKDFSPKLDILYMIAAVAW